MGFSTAQGSSAHTQCVLKIENFVSYDMSLRLCDQMEEGLEQTAQITSRRSFLGALKVSLASELTIKGKIQHLLAKMYDIVYILVTGGPR